MAACIVNMSSARLLSPLRWILTVWHAACLLRPCNIASISQSAVLQSFRGFGLCCFDIVCADFECTFNCSGFSQLIRSLAHLAISEWMAIKLPAMEYLEVHSVCIDGKYDSKVHHWVIRFCFMILHCWLTHNHTWQGDALTAVPRSQLLAVVSLETAAACSDLI